MRTIGHRAKVVLGLLVIAVAIQLIGIAPGLEYISGAFPTYFHKTESAVLVLVLFVSLIIASLNSGRLQSAALTIIAALMFYSGYKVFMTINAATPLHARVIWIVVSVTMTAALAWIIIGASRLGKYGWQSLSLSLALAISGFVYLRLAPSL